MGASVVVASMLFSRACMDDGDVMVGDGVGAVSA